MNMQLLQVGCLPLLSTAFGSQAMAGPFFTDVTSELIPEHPTVPCPDGTYFMPESIAGGIALFDYDDDGDLDILQVRFSLPDPTSPAPNRLYQQQSDGHFRDVTSTARIGDPGYGIGAAVGDADEDGDLDVYVTNYGRDRFYRNNGDGTFADWTTEAGLVGNQWSSSATFVDYDGDGDLDLYVVHYVAYRPGVICRGHHGAQDYCDPQQFDGTIDSLYRNDGEGHFADIARQVGIDAPGRGLGVIGADLTGDGHVDFYVANDQGINQFWVNRGDGTFTDEAILRGLGTNGYGQPEASMGIAIGDVNGDGMQDLFVTSLRNETNTPYLAVDYTGSGNLFFEDVAPDAGLAAPSLAYTGMGCGLFDLENDGDLDIAIVNGGVRRGPGHPGAGVSDYWNPYAQPNLLFRNEEEGKFEDVSAIAGTFATTLDVNRGLALGDIDRDGDLDLVTTNVQSNMSGVPWIFRNDAPKRGNHWLTVQTLLDRRDALGATVRIVTETGTQTRLVIAGYSYLSSNEPCAHFGLGRADGINLLEVTWPDGRRETFDVPAVDREITLRRGEGHLLH